MQQLLQILLEQAGARVRTAASAAAALAAFDRFSPDLLISDIGMPGMDGYMLIRQVRSRPPEQGGQVPAIALTAFASQADQQLALTSGFHCHLAKPAEPERLLELITSLVQS